MFRTPLAGAALLTLVFLPGCGLFSGDRPGLCNRCRGNQSGRVDASPASYPVVDAGCGGMVIPPGGHLIGGPGGYPMGEPLPMPGGTNPPRIPRIGIDEGKGKQFELEGASRTGPALMMPATGAKMN
jgi:hypothetical protein